MTQEAEMKDDLRILALEKIAAGPAAPAVPFKGVGINPVAQLLHARFKNPSLVAGILANIDRETGGTFDYRTWEKKYAKNGAFNASLPQKGGYGLFQLTGPNLRNYKAWLLQKKIKDSAGAQIDFAYNVLGPNSGKTRWNRYLSPKASYTPEQYADFWYKNVERPGHTIKELYDKKTKSWYANPDYSPLKILQGTQRHNAFMKNRIKLVNGAWTAL